MYSLRTIQIQDNAQLAQIIREVSKEFGLAPEAGFAVADHLPALLHPHNAPELVRSRAFVYL